MTTCAAAHGLGLPVVAPGVEYAVSARRLLDLDCDVLQSSGGPPSLDHPGR